MSKKRAVLVAVVACALALAALVGCASTQNPSTSSSASTSSVSSSSASSSSASSASAAAERTVTDMAGREVTIPTTVNGVYCAVPTAEATVATIAPEKLIGWVNTPTDAALAYLPESLATLPVLGGWMGQQVTANMEDIIAAQPDLIIYMGTKASLSKDEVPGSIQEQTGIPVVCVSSALEDTAEAYRLLGDWVGDPQRGEELASFYEKHLADVVAKIDAVPEDQHPTVYYAENADGLATDPTGSTHTEVIDYCKAVNVADVEMKSGQGRTDVTIEQVIGWNPEMILCHSGFVLADDILSNPQWADIQAVKDGAVYTTPAVPFNWFDRPPNAMRLMGIEWFAKVCYPDINIDLESDVKEFFKLFYKVDLTDQQLSELLEQTEISYRENQR